MKKSILVCGSLAQKPYQGGHTWVFLQYLLGLRKLGWDVLFLDQLEREMCVGCDGKPCSVQDSVNLRYFLRIMDDFDLKGHYALLCDRGTWEIGVNRQAILERSSRAALVLNIMGFLRDEEILGRSQKRVFLDIDPGFGQMWQELGLHAALTGHDCYVTIGQNIGRPDCGIPTCGLSWITTPQPVVLDFWPYTESNHSLSFTTIASWRGAYGPIQMDGKTYGLRVHEFRKYAALPLVTGERFELALNIHSADHADRRLLEANGWILVDPREAAGDPWRYRSYIQSSGVEFMVAKNMYVETNSGWFSDRSICYLASGKPVLTQNTGTDGIYPCGRGLVTFSSIEEAVSGVQEIRRNYRGHSQAARELALEYFDSNKVLSCLLKKLDVL